MKKISKGILIVASILGLLQVLWFVALAYPLKPVVEVIKGFQLPRDFLLYTSLILAGISTLIFLVLLMYGIFVPVKHQEVRFDSANGKLRISKSSIEKMVKNKVKEIPNLTDVDVDLKILGKNRQAKMFISAFSTEEQNLHRQGENIKRIANEQLAKHLSIPIKKTTVDLKPNLNRGKVKVV
ncbi:alkaline shock response membrane anchor protein AmaP [Companilactobacillus paralimentarius]|uniref:alkaline shock response membrane anchor protein AmaP n=1 Tax=Companilactobacillus paralimentarius TaxID=83526 RepID=UPI0038507E06